MVDGGGERERDDIEMATNTYEEMVDKELDKVEDDEEREEGVEVHVEGEPPLYILKISDLSFCTKIIDLS